MVLESHPGPEACKGIHYAIASRAVCCRDKLEHQLAHVAKLSIKQLLLDLNLDKYFAIQGKWRLLHK